MLIISHRGTINGPDPKLENKIETIEHCIKQNLPVEIDLWMKKDKFYLGHDEPTYFVELDFLIKNRKMLWIHCKNFKALNFLNNYPKLNYFFHDQDKFTLTSNGVIWTFPKQEVDVNSVIVCLDKKTTKKYYKTKCMGVCTDYPKILSDIILDG